MILLYSRKLSMQYYGCQTICIFCIVKGVEQAETDRFSIDHDPDPPFLRLTVPANAFEPACVAPHPVAIAIVLSTSSEPQVDPAIIVFTSVLVIDFAGRPVTGHNYPSEATGEISRAINGNTARSVALFPSCGFPDLSASARSLPRQYPRLRLVIEKAADVLRREVVASAFVSHRKSLP